MNGKINNKGMLQIKRAGKMKAQGCPFTEEEYCGDQCPLFGEPTVSKWMGSINTDAPEREKDERYWDLSLCKKTLLFDVFKDERRK